MEEGIVVVKCDVIASTSSSKMTRDKKCFDKSFANREEFLSFSICSATELLSGASPGNASMRNVHKHRVHS